MEIRHVIFDLSEVLFTGIKDTGINLGIRHGLDPASMLKGPTGSPNPLMLPAVWEFFHGKMTENQYIAAVVDAYPQFGPHQTLKNHIRKNFREVEGTRAIVNRVRNAGYHLSLLSVHGREWIEYCDMVFDFHILFDTLNYSYVDGVSKPHPDAFHKTLARLKAEPQECVFIDDSAANVEAARKLGIVGIQFTHAPALEEDLLRILPNFR